MATMIGTLGQLGVGDRFLGLRHDAVIARDHQDDDVRHLGAAGAHGGEGLVTGRVEEGDLLLRRQRHLIGADMLGDATRFVRRHVGGAQRVEQRGLAVIDVAHDGDHRRPRDHRLVGIGRIREAGLDVALGDALEPVAHLRHHQLGGVGIDHLVDGGHHAHAHQRLDHVGAALGHAGGEFLDCDGLGNRDLAIDFLLRLVGVLAATLTLQAATLLRHRPAAEIVLALDRATHVDLVGAALRSLAARTRRPRRTLRRCQGRAHRRTTQSTGARGLRRRRTRRGGARVRAAPVGGRRAAGRADLLDLAGHRRLRRAPAWSMRFCTSARPCA
jgi:hypothetical protein